MHTRIVQTFVREGQPDDVTLETLWFDAWLASGMESSVNDGYTNPDRLLADN